MPLWTDSSVRNGWNKDQVNDRLDFGYKGTRGGHITTTGMRLTGTLTVDGATTLTGATTQTGALTVSDATDSTTGATGAIHTLGGVGITKALFVGTTSTLTGVVTVSDSTTSTSGATGSIHTAGGIGAAGTIYAAGLLTAAANIAVTGQAKLGATSARGTTQGISSLEIKAGTAPVGAATTTVSLYTDGTTMKKMIADGTASDVQT